MVIELKMATLITDRNEVEIERVQGDSIASTANNAEERLDIWRLVNGSLL